MWLEILSFTIALASQLFFKPKVAKLKPAGLNEVTVPTAEIGREVPVLFGERDLEGPNVVYYGGFRTSAIKKKGGKK